MRRALWFSALALIIPSAAHAQVLSQVAGVFNIIVGLMLVASFLLFFGGLAMWVSRLGTYPTNRDEAIRMMQWAVVTLFVLAAFLAISQFIQKHAAMASFVIGVVVVGLAIWFISTVVLAEKKEEEH
jgi:xanthine/uracil permease